MTNDPDRNTDISDLRAQVEDLTLRLRHSENDDALCREEYELTTVKYLDILTEIRRKNAELGALQRHLEERVKERTAMLEHVNQSLAQEIESHQRTEDALQALLREKEVLIREVHHRVKNNLQVIISLLNMQADTCPDAAMAALLREGQTRIRSMALVHEELYNAEDLATIRMDHYLRQLTTQLMDAYSAAGQVELELAVDAISLAVDRAIPCGLIVNELVTNALKHGLPPRGESAAGRRARIVVRLAPAGRQLVLSVENDDGVRFPDHIDIRASASLGLQLVNVLTAQLHGTLDLQHENGVRFTILFPAAGPAGPRAAIASNVKN